MRLNQAVLQIAVQSGERVAVLRGRLAPQREAQLPQNLYCLRNRIAARQNVARAMRRHRFLHRLHGAFIQHARKLHRRRRRHTARNVFLAGVDWVS